MIKGQDHLDQKIKNLEKKLGIGSKQKKKTKKTKADSDSSDFYNFSDSEKNSDNDQHVNQKSKNLNSFDNIAHKTSEVDKTKILSDVKIELTYDDVNFVIKRINPSKHFFNFLEKAKNSTEKSLKDISKKLSQDLFENSPKINRETLVKIIIIGLLYSAQPKTIQFFFEEFSKAYKSGSCSILHLIACYMYSFQLIQLRFFVDLLKVNIEQLNYDIVSQSLSLTGKWMRKENPKVILEIEELIFKDASKNVKVELLRTLIKKIRNNHDIECQLVENFTKYKKICRGLIHHSETIDIFPDLKFILKENLSKFPDWFENSVQHKIEEKHENKHEELLLKYEKMHLKLDLTHYNEKLIVSFILDSSNFLEAAEKICKMRVFRKNYQDIPRSIFILINAEVEFNEYYLYLSSKLIEFMDDLRYTFYRFIWNFYNHLDELFDKKLIRFVIRFAVGCLKLNSFDFKFFKNLDFSTISKNKKLFNRNFFKSVLQELSSNFVDQQIKKYLKSDEKVLMVDEIEDFVKKYERLYFEKDFPDQTSATQPRLVIELFKSIK